MTDAHEASLAPRGSASRAQAPAAIRGEEPGVHLADGRGGEAEDDADLLHGKPAHVMEIEQISFLKGEPLHCPIPQIFGLGPRGWPWAVIGSVDRSLQIPLHVGETSQLSLGALVRWIPAPDLLCSVHQWGYNRS